MGNKTFGQKFIPAFCVLLLVSVFLVFRLPYYVSYFVPSFSPDSYDYYYQAYLITESRFSDIQNLPLDIPLGYSLFLTTLFSAPKFLVILCQSLIFLFAGIFLFLASQKSFGNYALIFLLFILSAFADNRYLTYESLLNSESLFISFVFVFLGVLITLIKNPAYSVVVFMFVCIAILILLRPNGIVFFGVPLFLFVLRGFRSRKFIKAITAGYVILFLLLSSLNYFYKGYFFPVEIKRYQNILSDYQTKKNISESSDADNAGIIKKEESVSVRFRKSLKAFYEEWPSFYYSILPERVKNFEISKTYKAFNNSLEIGTEVRNKILSEQAANSPESFKAPDFHRKDYLYLIHGLSKVQDIIFRNVVFMILFFAALIYGIVLWIKKRQPDEIIFFVLLSFLLYSGNLLLSVAGNKIFQARYTQTFDIFVYFGLFIFIFSVVKNDRLIFWVKSLISVRKHE